MLAAWYDRQGPAAEVLATGDIPVPVPGAGEVRVRISLSGVKATASTRRALGSAFGSTARSRATVIGTVRHTSDLDLVAVGQAVALDHAQPAEAIRALAPSGVDRIVEVAFSDNVDLDAAVAPRTRR